MRGPRKNSEISERPVDSSDYCFNFRHISGVSFRDRALAQCFNCFPCLSDPARRSSLVLKVQLVMLHLIFVGMLFLFTGDLIEKTEKEPCKDGLLQAKMEFQGSNSSSWTKLVMDMYPPGTFIRSCTCSYCNVEQPPRAEHCHDCGQCVLQFDHHCSWLGTCVGRDNHCKFWWNYAIMILLLIALSVTILILLLLLLFHSYLILTNDVPTPSYANIVQRASRPNDQVLQNMNHSRQGRQEPNSPTPSSVKDPAGERPLSSEDRVNQNMNHIPLETQESQMINDPSTPDPEKLNEYMLPTSENDPNFRSTRRRRHPFLKL